MQNPEDLLVLQKLGVRREKLTLLGNGIDLDRFDPARVDVATAAMLRHEVGAGPDDVVCGVVGRLVWEKGYRDFFNAATQLRRRIPHLKFVVLGPSDPRKRDAVTDVDLRRAEAEANIRFLGLRDDIAALYAAMDLYALASRREGWPRSAMEAAAMRLPIVATDIRGCRQVVEHGVTGILVPARDAEALADAIESLARDPGARQRMGRAAQRKARREFDQQRVIDITLGVYERLVRCGTGRRPRKQA